jgi:hypothetical protein
MIFKEVLYARVGNRPMESYNSLLAGQPEKRIKGTAPANTIYIIDFTIPLDYRLIHE